MKYITIALFTILLSFSFTTESKAQYGVQAGVLAPTGNWGDIWSAGFGGQVFYKIDQGEDISYGGSIGYYSLPGSTVDFVFASIEYPSANIIPILGTFDYKLSDKFYVGGDVGYNFISLGSLDQTATTSVGSSFALIPKAGVSFGSAFAEARLNIVGDSYLSLVVGISLGGGE